MSCGLSRLGAWAGGRCVQGHSSGTGERQVLSSWCHMGTQDRPLYRHTAVLPVAMAYLGVVRCIRLCGHNDICGFAPDRCLVILTCPARHVLGVATQAERVSVCVSWGTQQAMHHCLKWHLESLLQVVL